jgi:hypothetical protein
MPPFIDESIHSAIAMNAHNAHEMLATIPRFKAQIPIMAKTPS